MNKNELKQLKLDEEGSISADLFITDCRLSGALGNDDKNAVDMEERNRTSEKRKFRNKRRKHIFKKRQKIYKKRKYLRKKILQCLSQPNQITMSDNQQKEESKQIEMCSTKMQSLTEEQKSIVQQAFEKAEKNPALSFNGEYGCLHSIDILLLKPRRWLNDEIINYYCAMLEKRNKMEINRHKCNIILMNSFFYAKLVVNGYDYAAVSRWTKPAQIKKRGFSGNVKTIFDLDKVIFPINMNNHWFCCCLNIRYKRIEFYNSINFDHSQLYVIFKRYINDEIHDKKLTIKEDWSYYTPTGIPLQDNNCDCGVFTCKFIDWLCDDLVPDFKQKDIYDFRLKIAYEIITDKLL
ncbi:Ulp1 protease family, catalytic domain containing protein [Reticulomyxa filosa]|uniref:Ulp1 protease family, catalytic domain containing protein n=1 Tax=Reticulomyxa filosa TaxID=46433 RepID=X6NX47_RETFI|nr:Ulp1 protease family, catalytic domain containing protein [Reticulomyxa filosa]|eukprot:ETO30865.1 Ulp1 protease family, catalytic domain containing protein [Reticulomyxa filosa]